MSLVLFMFQSILNIFVFFCFFWLKKLIIFMDGGTPFAENSAKIINLIFEPFPKSLKMHKSMSKILTKL